MAPVTTSNLCLSRFNPKQIMIPTTIRRQQVVSDRTSFHICCAVSSTTQVSVSDQPKDGRRSANYQPSIWSYDFLQSLNNVHADVLYKERAGELEQEVRFAIHDEDAEPVNLLELIDDIQRLGWGIVSRRISIGPFRSPCPQTTPVSRRSIADAGMLSNADVFKVFKDDKGSFKECLYKDVKGMLSLNEASHLAFEGEDLMEEALEFSRVHLMDLHGVRNLEKGLLEQVIHSLELPLHRQMLRLEARWYIEAYGRKNATKHTQLELAKLDFNMVQSTLQEDLQEMTRKISSSKHVLCTCNSNGVAFVMFD
ncbi:hypothetical protein F3Y22_tig00116976pilonHSYRG00016 [Hibiscus syriacus]|uniref:Terpene synthase N-terminal domain-containing protein n=1 Tax=Hibiscus syriacus TaxID=106335 RepID=A0A6A2WQJ1_HIBSY|nr:hypothetical protein F3Y22_tig00116976pilonHSYRG00016 [Hibiscus syriacus]